MDRGDIWIVDALEGILPPQALTLVRDHIQHPQLILPSLWEQTSKLTHTVAASLSPLLSPLLARAVRALHDSPDLVVLAFLLAVFVLALQIVSWIHRAALLAARLAFRAAAWALLAALVAVVWRRGPEATARDLAVLVGRLAGYAALVRDIWWSEYQRFDAQTRRSAAAGATSAAGYGQGAGAAAGYTRAGRGGW
ncbi:hypothetical protein GGS23DRAFT_592430 [Durotheca rogersii]|uniref:uncharacterized protein n=1 Tax=Durotheca rogersii TaxID=419775 RepID=UPI00221F1673|nr:uncharacterized protein GGS23DRAFT_592430 [Durotheca rogersii]KAI5868671.1 hypothetical protein GGS23DRAFT_592430 [Durotheca rogersii]